MPPGVFLVSSSSVSARNCLLALSGIGPEAVQVPSVVKGAKRIPAVAASGSWCDGRSVFAAVCSPSTFVESTRRRPTPNLPTHLLQYFGGVIVSEHVREECSCKQRESSRFAFLEHAFTLSAFKWESPRSVAILWWLAFCWREGLLHDTIRSSASVALATSSININNWGGFRTVTRGFLFF